MPASASTQLSFGVKQVNKKQIIVSYVGGGIIIARILYPPWCEIVPARESTLTLRHSGDRDDGKENLWPSISQYYGINERIPLSGSFIWNPPKLINKNNYELTNSQKYILYMYWDSYEAKEIKRKAGYGKIDLIRIATHIIITLIVMTIYIHLLRKGDMREELRDIKFEVRQ